MELLVVFRGFDLGGDQALGHLPVPVGVPIRAPLGLPYLTRQFAGPFEFLLFVHWGYQVLKMAMGLLSNTSRSRLGVRSTSSVLPVNTLR